MNDMLYDPEINTMSMSVYVSYRNVLQQSFYAGELSLNFSGQPYHKLKHSSQLQ